MNDAGKLELAMRMAEMLEMAADGSGNRGMKRLFSHLSALYEQDAEVLLRSFEDSYDDEFLAELGISP